MAEWNGEEGGGGPAQFFFLDIGFLSQKIVLCIVS